MGPAPYAAQVPEARLPSLPETLGYRIKRKLLGPPLISEQISAEKLGKPTALAVLSSDVMSSSAYATEQLLYPLFGVIGVAAFSRLVPMTLAIIGVLVLVTLLYRRVVQAYPRAGGAYVVSRENLGALTSQVAAASLLVDYTLTVAVSVAAGTAAVTSAVPSLRPVTTPIAVAFVILLAYGNLRGIREAGRVFAVPTYFFIANMAALAVVGTIRALAGDLHAHSIYLPGAHPGHAAGGLFAGASILIVLRAYASGSSALTGTEAISNGVSVFRPPQARNARTTLVLMSLILGGMFLTVSVFASLTHPVPYRSGTPTVISQVAAYVYGTGGSGRFLYYLMQTGTALILILAANTSFTGFPFLASFAAEDRFLPRQLMRRGHRLVFSNGIVTLTVVAVALLIFTNSNVDSLIAMYAIGVFTGFMLSGAGMVRYFWHQRGAGWRRDLAICGAAGVLAAIVDGVFIVAKFAEGAWLVVVLLPLLVAAFSRLNRQYRSEASVLSESAAAGAAEAPVLRHQTVLILVDRLDLATARAIQYARSLNPDELRAVHFVVDMAHADQLSERWTRLDVSRLPLELIECPDRRILRAALQLADEASADGQTEVTILLPRRAYSGLLSRVLHDETADRIVSVVSQLPHVTATIVPFPVNTAVAHIRRKREAALEESNGAVRHRWGADLENLPPMEVPGTTPIADIQVRKPARVAGRVRSVRVQPWAGVPSLEATLADQSGGRVVVTFMGRRRVPGIEPGCKMVAEGMVGTHRGQPAMLNPNYEILALAEPEQ